MDTGAQFLNSAKVCVLLALDAVLGASAFGQVSVKFANLHPTSSRWSYANCVSASQQAGQIYVGTNYHAALWSGSVESLVDLNPPGAVASEVYEMSGGQQVGIASIGGKGCAGFWSGTATSFIDLIPPGASGGVDGVGGFQQVGWVADRYGRRHAALWSGTSNSWVDLHPAVWKSSGAYATSGSNQVGYVEKYDGSGRRYAAFWSGSAASFVELGPEWWASTTVVWSVASAIGGTNQAGYYQMYSEYVNKAALWSGTPQSFVSLHPFGATASAVWATTDSLQVGFATVSGQPCLGIWRGTPQSFVNLGPLATGLGTGVSNITVRAISIEGNKILLAGDADSQAIFCTIQLHPPRLNLAVAQVQGGVKVFTLMWTNNGVPCALESSSTPVSGWSIASSPWTTNASCSSVSITNAGPAQFFRLKEK